MPIKIELTRREFETAALMLMFYAMRVGGTAEAWAAETISGKIRKQLDASSPLKRIWKGGKLCRSK